MSRFYSFFTKHNKNNDGLIVIDNNKSKKDLDIAKEYCNQGYLKRLSPKGLLFHLTDHGEREIRMAVKALETLKTK